jgi:carbonic anhydrase
MACTSPIDITSANAPKCQLKCLYWFKYGDSSCTVVNNTNSLSVTYDGASDVVYNNVKYTPTTMTIFKPSLHTFNGTPAEGEVIITHTSNQDGLLVCIPISSKGASTTGSGILEAIISDAPLASEGAASLNVPNFNANYLIPKSGYFTYTGTLPFSANCGSSTSYQIVVFPKLGAISIDTSAMNALGKLITFSYINTVEGTAFYNEKGTSANGFSGDGQIYIDCQPVGESDDTVVTPTSTSTKSASSSSNNEALIGAMVMILIVGFLFLFGYVMTIGFSPTADTSVYSIVGLVVIVFAATALTKNLS